MPCVADFPESDQRGVRWHIERSGRSIHTGLSGKACVLLQQSRCFQARLQTIFVKSVACPRTTVISVLLPLQGRYLRLCPDGDKVKNRVCVVKAAVDMLGLDF